MSDLICEVLTGESPVAATKLKIIAVPAKPVIPRQHYAFSPDQNAFKSETSSYSYAASRSMRTETSIIEEYNVSLETHVHYIPHVSFFSFEDVERGCAVRHSQGGCPYRS